MNLTKQQRQALKRAYDWHQPVGTYRQFRRRVVPAIGGDYVMAPIIHDPRSTRQPLWLGIETDGYTHS